SDASTGMPRALLAAGAVTALRTGAAAALAAETLGREGAKTAAVVGAGVNGRAAARALLAIGRDVMLWDVDDERGRAAADELGARGRDDVTELGAVLMGDAEGRRSDDEVTVFDSTGLAIQDLAIALAALERADELDLPMFDL